MRIATMLVAATVLALPAMPPAVGAPPDDPGFSQQWNLPIVGAPEAWEKGTGRGITIAVVDTGVDLGHEDLRGQVTRHVSCIGAGGDPAKCRENEGQDDHGHGTHVAGVAAASTSNRVGVASIAPDARIMAVRVLRADDDGGGARGAAADVEAGIRWAVEHGADVVNLSLGEKVAIGGLTLPLQTRLADAIEDAWAAGVIPVVAAGNSESLFGSGYGELHAVVVTATTRDDAKASYATGSGDARWGMAAPGGAAAEEGEGILSTWWTLDAPYAWSAGTSMAAPHVSGAAALLRSLGLSPQQTVDRLLDTAHDVGPEGTDSQTGAGRLDIAAATASFPAGDDQEPSGSPGVESTTTAPVAATPTSGSSMVVGETSPDGAPRERSAPTMGDITSTDPPTTMTSASPAPAERSDAGASAPASVAGGTTSDPDSDTDRSWLAWVAATGALIVVTYLLHRRAQNARSRWEADS